MDSIVSPQHVPATVIQHIPLMSQLQTYQFDLRDVATILSFFNCFSINLCYAHWFKVIHTAAVSKKKRTKRIQRHRSRIVHQAIHAPRQQPSFTSHSNRMRTAWLDHVADIFILSAFHLTHLILFCLDIMTYFTLAWLICSDPDGFTETG